MAWRPEPSQEETLDEETFAFDPDFLVLGWARWLPPTALFAYMAVMFLHLHDVPGDLDDQPPGSTFRRLLDSVGGLDGPAWDEEDRPGEGGREDPARAEAARRRIERTSRIARRAGMAGVETNRDLFELMRRLGIVERIEEAGQVRWLTPSPLPLPEERIPMSRQERIREDRLRWGELHYRPARRIVDCFVALGLTAAATSLERLAQLLEADVEAIREAVLVLLEDRAFRASADVERLTGGEPFELWVDRELLDEDRLADRLVRPDEKDPP